MTGRYGAVAEGYINGVWVSSLGKAGVDKNGKLKDEDCYSAEKAWMRALRVVANKGRFVIEAPYGWTNFPDLPKTTQQKLLEDAMAGTVWEIVSTNLYRATINENLFQFSREGALA